jgi:hypothetical protein
MALWEGNLQNQSVASVASAIAPSLSRFFFGLPELRLLLNHVSINFVLRIGLKKTKNAIS